MDIPSAGSIVARRQRALALERDRAVPGIRFGLALAVLVILVAGRVAFAVLDDRALDVEDGDEPRRRGGHVEGGGRDEAEDDVAVPIGARARQLAVRRMESA